MKKVDPKAVWLFFTNFVSRWFVAVVILAVFIIFPVDDLRSIDIARDEAEYLLFTFINWMAIIIPVFLIIAFIWAKLTYRFYQYELTDAGISIESGIFYKKHIFIPYNHIENINIYRGILCYILGLSNLNIQVYRDLAPADSFININDNVNSQLLAISRKDSNCLYDEITKRVYQSKKTG